MHETLSREESRLSCFPEDLKVKTQYSKDVTTCLNVHPASSPLNFNHISYMQMHVCKNMVLESSAMGHNQDQQPMSQHLIKKKIKIIDLQKLPVKINVLPRLPLKIHKKGIDNIIVSGP